MAVCGRGGRGRGHRGRPRPGARLLRLGTGADAVEADDLLRIAVPRVRLLRLEARLQTAGGASAAHACQTPARNPDVHHTPEERERATGDAGQRRDRDAASQTSAGRYADLADAERGRETVDSHMGSTGTTPAGTNRAAVPRHSDRPCRAVRMHGVRACMACMACEDLVFVTQKLQPWPGRLSLDCVGIEQTGRVHHCSHPAMRLLDAANTAREGGGRGLRRPLRTCPSDAPAPPGTGGAACAAPIVR